MNPILFAILLVSGVGLIAGVLLVIAGKFMSVPADEKAETIEKMLPGANCGGCGFSGCSGYASAISQNGAKPNLCVVGGPDVAKQISEFLGVEAESIERRAAAVLCAGKDGCALRKAEYNGLQSCKSVNALFGGINVCKYGCIGLGDCVKVCENKAISIKEGVANIDVDNCIACGKCVSACPKKLINLVSYEKKPLVLCSNLDNGAMTRKACTSGCIGCKMCEKACETGAIKVDGFKASVDRKKCIGCGKCIEACKVGCIKNFLE